MELKAALSIEEAQEYLGLGRTKLYSLLKTGKLKALKLGKRTLIRRVDLDIFLENLEHYPANAGEQSAAN